MMLLLLYRRLSHLLSCSSTALHTTTLISSPHHLLKSLERFSNIASGQNPSPKPPFIVQYLINSCGFSSDEALKASKHLTHIESPSKPDSVLYFLKQSGLGDAHIRNLLSMHPELLRSKVEKTLRPKFRALQEMGFSEPELTLLVSNCPSALRSCNLGPKIEFWRALFGTNEKLLRAITKDQYLLTSNLAKKVLPNVSLLRKCSISDDRIGKMILQVPRFITKNPDSIKDAIERTEALGVPRGSGMFWKVLLTFARISRATFDAKFKFLQSLGWSESEILSAIRQAPSLLGLSQKRIHDSMEFLLKEVGHESSYIASSPVLLLYSLQRRLIPRHHVLRTLNQEKLIGSGYKLLSSAAALSDDKFIERFILPHGEKVPWLHEAYLAACGGQIPSQIKA